MRVRPLFAFSILLLFVLAGCSNKAGNTTANSATPSSGTSSSATSSSEAPSSTASGSDTGSSTTPAQSAQQAPPPVVVPEGTHLTVRLGEDLGSKLSTAGQSFSATLADPVTVDGNTVIPAGAAAKGTVVDARPLGRFKGGAVLEVRLTSITINGAEQAIETSAVSREEKGKGKRTAVLAGGGGALGAIIGGIAGGGKGAAVGALVGGGAGGAGSAFTGNKEIVLPAESALTFRLKSPLEVKPPK